MTVERLMASICSGIESTNASSAGWPKFVILTPNTRKESNSGRTPNTNSQGQLPRSSLRSFLRWRKNCVTEWYNPYSSSCPTNTKRNANRCGRKVWTPSITWSLAKTTAAALGSSKMPCRVRLWRLWAWAILARTMWDMRVSTRSRWVRFLMVTDWKAESHEWCRARYAPRIKCLRVCSFLSSTVRTSPMSANPSSSSARRVNFRRFRKADTPTASKCQPL